MTDWSVVVVMGIVVAIAIALDPIFARLRPKNDEPPKHIRRAWLAKRTGRDT